MQVILEGKEYDKLKKESQSYNRLKKRLPVSEIDYYRGEVLCIYNSNETIEKLKTTIKELRNELEKNKDSLELKKLKDEHFKLMENYKDLYNRENKLREELKNKKSWFK